MATEKNTLTVEDALQALREMFPKGHLRAESRAAEADKQDDPDSESSTFAMVVISRASERGAKSFRGLSLADCVNQAREWKQAQQ